MKASELIKKIEKEIKDHGDLPVYGQTITRFPYELDAVQYSDITENPIYPFMSTPAHIRIFSLND